MRLGKGRKSPDEMTFLEHLEDLRKRLFYSAIALIIGVLPCWAYRETIFKILAGPVMKYLPPGTKFSFLTLTAPFMMYMKIAFLASLFLTAPFIFLQVWYFVAPGLYQKEKKYVIPFVLMTSFFFALGAVFGYFIVYPFACRFFLNIGQQFQPVLTPDQYLSFSVTILASIALVFELPTLIYFLAKMGLVTAGWMTRNFKYAVLLVFIVAAVITPTPDPLTQSIVALPMLALYAVGIVIALVVGRNKEKAARRAESGTTAG
jgi:sec-independent protein translocase protein TatC